MAPIINSIPVKIRMVKSSSANRMEPVPARIIITIATTLVRRLMQRLSSQFLSIGPNNSLLSSHLCHFSDDLAKNQADSNRKGVAGRTGSNTPRMASPRNRNPRGLYRPVFSIVYLLCQSSMYCKYLPVTPSGQGRLVHKHKPVHCQNAHLHDALT